MKRALEILNQYFGYKNFRPGQEEIIKNIINGNDVFGVMPTGAGKSLCFQVPAIAMEGITIVVSPLISLMKDQVSSLVHSGIRGAYLNSSLSARQYVKALNNARNGIYKIIYVAPERLQTESFMDFAVNANISMVTVDEAHCVSQWGQDFRPGYLFVADFINSLPKRPVVSAFTATATSKVREDIINLLRLENPYVYIGGYNRENLYFEVKRPADKMKELFDIIKNMNGKSGIVYCSTRKTVEEVCENLFEAGFDATRYHAGLNDDERKRNQEDFIYDRRNIMVATNAFGMGIDKSNVSFVVHYNMPKDIESYYQEAGRAGRDGEKAECFLFYSGHDVVVNQFLIENSDDNSLLDAQTKNVVINQAKERLRKMSLYCGTKECLRDYILNYFGGEITKGCGNCGNCLKSFDVEDIFLEAKKVIMCVKSTGERYGTQLIIDVLRGAETSKIERLCLKQSSCYGVMKGVKKTRINEIIQFMLLNDYLKISDGDFPILILGDKSEEILKEKTHVYMKKFDDLKENVEFYKRALNISKVKMSSDKEKLFEKLKKIRAKISAREKIPAYIVFSNATLEDMCAKMPSNEREFLEVSGVGRKKMESYGEEFIEVIKEFT
ncbi:MAG: DNA helicase RecQ [Firmicutes bacterium]|nr:DNA helicase RecQ [Bacillota bacterium]